MVPAVYRNRAGFISGEATIKASRGAAGTPSRISWPTTGMAAKVHSGDTRPRALAPTMEAGVWRRSRRRTLATGR